jgi:hypothetical protein
MNGATSFPDWSSVLKRKAQLVHQQIAAMQRLVSESGGSDDIFAKSCASYYRLLDEIYEKDMPVARALDGSDLLLHLDGEGLQTEHPRLSLVTSIMGDVRKQVGAMIRTLVSSFNENLDLPREFELGLSSFAKGSLYLGFSLPEANPGYVVLAGDPLFAASRQALATLGAVTQHINEPNALALIRAEFADPKLRDAALTAVGQLAPSGRRGVSTLEIGGRAMPAGGWRLLTPETRQQVRAWLEQPVMSNEVVELRGRVRAIDLDLRRFDLRRIDNATLPDLRCIYPATFDAAAKKWLDTTVVVRGQVETFQGAARLLQIQSVEEIASDTRSED